MKVINRSSKYKNRYIHRRDSMSLAALSLDDRDKLARIGVVTRSSSDVQEEDVADHGDGVGGEDDLEDIEEVAEVGDDDVRGSAGNYDIEGYGVDAGRGGKGKGGAGGDLR